MKYLCLAYGDDDAMSKLPMERLETIAAECEPYVSDLQEGVSLIFHEGLETNSTTLRPVGGKVTVTDGPFVESREQIGGVFIFEARDLNDAIRIASKHLAAHLNGDIGWGFEIRQVMEA